MSTPAAVLSVEVCGSTTHVRFITSTVYRDDQAHEVGDSLTALAEPQAKVLLDLSGVQCLASAVLGNIVRGNRAITSAGGELRLCNLSAAVREEFSTTHLDDLLRIFHSEEAALSGW